MILHTNVTATPNEGGPRTGAGLTHDFYRDVFECNSIDDRGMRLDSTVHYGKDYDNAFWSGREMVYGDGDGDLFRRFTVSIDVIGHELTQGVTAAEAELDYEGESGALNEHFSDVFGSLLKQWHRKQRAEEADWIIGAGLFTPNVKGVGLRSMKAPGTAPRRPGAWQRPPARPHEETSTGAATTTVAFNAEALGFQSLRDAPDGLLEAHTGKALRQAVARRGGRGCATPR